ncbi:MAG: hypothetical protein GC185_08650 [Alphaproteobacteria bacterium]|nr:hypothetical protein [Alphaproteobacteria bacterium]
MDFKSKMKKAGEAALRFAKAVRRFLRNPQQLEASFIEAIRAGKIEKVKKLMEEGAKLDIDGYRAKQPLDVAREAKQTEIFALLLESGADPNRQSDYGASTPFLDAVRAGDTQAAIAMLDAPVKADIEARDRRGDSVFALAVATRNTALSAELMERGAKFDTRNSKNWSPLFYAVRNGDLAMTQKLLDKGARTDLADNEGRGLLDIARAYDRREAYRLVQSFLDAQVPEWQAPDADTVTHVSILRDAGYRLTEVFNFETERYAVITHNYETGRDITIVKTFAEMERDKSLAQAREKHAARKTPQPQPQPAAKG